MIYADPTASVVVAKFSSHPQPLDRKLFDDMSRACHAIGRELMGEYRTNIWSYPGINSFGKDRDAVLALHPTVKPVALVADAILDCSKRGGIVLDPFLGSGTTLIAAEKTGRRGCGIELDPQYCDVIVRRMARAFKVEAVHAANGKAFVEIERERTAEAATERQPVRENGAVEEVA